MSRSLAGGFDVAVRSAVAVDAGVRVVGTTLAVGVDVDSGAGAVVGIWAGLLVGLGVRFGLRMVASLGVGARVGTAVGSGLIVLVEAGAGTAGSAVVLGLGSSQATMATVRRTSSPPIMARVVTFIRCLNHTPPLCSRTYNLDVPTHPNVPGSARHLYTS